MHQSTVDTIVLLIGAATSCVLGFFYLFQVIWNKEDHSLGTRLFLALVSSSAFSLTIFLSVLALFPSTRLP